MRVDVAICKAKNLFLMDHLIEILDGLTSSLGSSLTIFGKEIVAGNFIKNAMKQSPGRYLCKSGIAFGSEFWQGFL